MVRAVQNSLVQAEELGITSANIDELIANNTDDNPDNDSNLAIRQLLGLEGNLGEALGLSNDFAVKAIKTVGNYGEMYDRHFDSNVLRRDSNELASNYGLQYSLPIGSTGNSSSVDITTVLFDEQYYLENNPDVAEAINNGTLSSAIAHFVTSGLTEGRAPSEYFAETYLKNNPDIAAGVENGDFSSGIHHFLKFGFAEGRFPSDLLQDFETFYLSQNAEAAAAVANGTYANGLEYLVMVGLSQGGDPFADYQTQMASENSQTDIITGMDESAIGNAEAFTTNGSENEESTNPEFDQLTGQPGVDTFTLNIENEKSTAISNFDAAEDIIQLPGSTADYRLGNAPEGLPAGTAIYRINGEEDDLIGLVQDVSELDLSAGYFSFV